MTGTVQDILIDRPAEGVLRITLNRPEARNALRTQTLREIAQTLAAAADDDATRAVVLTGGAKYFAAGADIREMAPLGPVDILLHERQRHWRTIATFPKPLVAAVCGYALGAGIAVEVDEPESALARAVELAATMAAKPPLAVRLAKAAVLRAFERPLSEALAAERQAFALLAASEDRHEGIAAFLEKRPPKFTGR